MKTINIFEEKDIEALWNTYLTDHKHFYRRGDEHSGIPKWETLRPGYMTLDAQHYFDELKIRAKEIETMARDYQLSSRKDDEETYSIKSGGYLNLIQG